MRIVWAMCGALALGACSPTVTRRAVVSPEEALALGDRAEVVAVQGQPTSGSIWKDETGTFLVNRFAGREPLAASDRISVEVTYSNGDNIPHEGVLGTEPKAAFLTTGLVMSIVGVALGTLGFIGADQPPPTCPPDQLICFEPDFRGLYVAVGILGAGCLAMGLAFTVAGLLTPVRIRRVALAPIVSPSTAGAALAGSF